MQFRRIPEGRSRFLSVFRVVLGVTLLPGTVLAQNLERPDHRTSEADTGPGNEHEDHQMLVLPVGDQWVLGGMAQLFPLVSTSRGVPEGRPLSTSEGLLSQAALMLQLESTDGRWAIRLTPNLEGFTMRDGELTPGGWGEGFLDARHPHTLLHEFMVSRNHRSESGWSASISGGRGFVPFGSDDPMGRPVAKYPTNHHLAQILERYTLNAALARDGWVIEGGVFDGTEPEDPWDIGNWRNFGNSAALRLMWASAGESVGPDEHIGHDVASGGGWELSLSMARVIEHGDSDDPTFLGHAGIRFEGSSRFGESYLLLEGARSFIEDGPVSGYESVLAEGALRRSMLRGYARGEWATRPEYPRQSGAQGFYRYDHHDSAEGATRWLILSAGAELLTGWGPIALRPFLEVANQRVTPEVGEIDPRLPVDRWFTLLTVGVRIFPGGGPMRMGPYGLRDDMSPMLRAHSPDEAGHMMH